MWNIGQFSVPVLVVIIGDPPFVTVDDQAVPWCWFGCKEEKINTKPV